MVLPRLYGILDVALARRLALDPIDVTSAWLDAGIRLIQLRGKDLGLGPMLALADRLGEACRAAGALFIVNDRADVARLAGASGVHVGQEDLSPADVRGIVGPAAMVGLSTHSIEQLAAAVDQPVSYVALGPVFGTATKANPGAALGLAPFGPGSRLAAGRDLPLVAIGGITRASADAVIQAGATSVAVAADLLAPDPGARAKDWLARLS